MPFPKREGKAIGKPGSLDLLREQLRLRLRNTGRGPKNP